MSEDPRVNRSLERVERVLRSLDERDGPARAAAKRERKRLNADLGRRAARVGIAVGLVSLVTIIVGLVMPIGMFGFLAAVGLAIGIAALLAFMPTKDRGTAPPAKDLPNGEMVQQFDSYLFRSRRALPAPAQAEIDAISTGLPSLKQTLDRLDPMDPNAQDARRLMSIHLPGLIDRYVNVPPNYRQERDGEDKTVDERLVEGLAAGRSALHDIGEKIARSDIAALETQGRFIKTRYGEERIEG
ncbi:hypothetical protein G7077_12010 [Sphingomonas piscis]|uniref:Uncharacterized protein n=1 Tax=Sphingomonas piscis TaxID=2714943 RepID=A0A6G7YS13_9SPHN|nr:hypothetical protein [Sphingomonas piscis]QIK79524.1 hypothetical protein G7077_12010 [Sphingomonas piscis]